ncbi:MAG: twin-arginine translocation pathway signal protein, partial [Planctomycetota bacterium]
ARKPGFDMAKEGDAPGAVLLGERQLAFLEAWAADWSNDTWMKVALSQTIFANVATLPGDATNDGVIGGLPPEAAGTYPEGHHLAADCDSNGWPQSGRNRALRALRKCFALHIAGDQHLGSLIQYGVDDWEDAGLGFCVPSVANAWPRRWFPPTPGEGHLRDFPKYTGRYFDGFGNRMTVRAVSNPMVTELEPARLHDHAPGYGIVRFRRMGRRVLVECWPRSVAIPATADRQYPGWPARFHPRDVVTGRPEGKLCRVITDLDEPVFQVIDSETGEIVYTARSENPWFEASGLVPGRAYDLRVGDPDRNLWRTLEGEMSALSHSHGGISIEFGEPK